MNDNPNTDNNREEIEDRLNRLKSVFCAREEHSQVDLRIKGLSRH